jgi:hypothetical protein
MQLNCYNKLIQTEEGSMLLLDFDRLNVYLQSEVGKKEYPNSKVYPALDFEKALKIQNSNESIPSEYFEFLKLSNGVKNIGNGFHIIGFQDDFQEQLLHIQNLIRLSDERASKDYEINTDDLIEIRNWEQRTIQYYLPHYFIFGTNMDNELLFFNKYNFNSVGEYEIVLWHSDDGVKKEYENFNNFIVSMIENMVK